MIERWRDRVHPAWVLLPLAGAVAAVVAWWVWPERPLPPPSEVVGTPGFFHLERQEGTWWLVDPAGERFVSVGINHLGPDFLLSDLNREQTLARWGAGFAGPDGQADVEGAPVQAWHAEARAQVKGWGFNTLGWHNHVPQADMPYVLGFRPAQIDGWVREKHFPDPWDPATAARVDALAAKTLDPKADDRLVIGVGFNDVIWWQVVPAKHHPWQQALMRLPADAPGKRAWLDHLRGRYTAPAEVARVYGVEATTWDELARVREWPETAPGRMRAHEDGLAFAPKLARAWYGLVTKVVRAHAPNHLVLGDKLNGDPNLPEWLDPIVDDLFDALFLEWRVRFDEQRERLAAFHEETGKPVLLGDSGFTTPTDVLPEPKRIQVESSEQVGVEYARYLEAAIREPYVIGWHHCGYIMGSPDLKRRSDMMAKQYGFLDPDGTPHEAEVRAVTAANAQAFRWHEEGPAADRAGTPGPR